MTERERQSFETWKFNNGRNINTKFSKLLKIIILGVIIFRIKYSLHSGPNRALGGSRYLYNL